MNKSCSELGTYTQRCQDRWDARVTCLSSDSDSDYVAAAVGLQVTQRQLKKELKLPEFANVDRVEHRLEEDGQLVVDIVLKNEGPYKCHVTTHDLSPTSAAAAAAGDLDDDEEDDDDVDDDRNYRDDDDARSADINGFGV